MKSIICCSWYMKVLFSHLTSAEIVERPAYIRYISEYFDDNYFTFDDAI